MQVRPKTGVRTAAKLLLGNLVLLVVLLELAGNVVCLARTGRPAWARREASAAAGKPHEGLTGDFPVRLHPYLGYVYRPTSTFAPGTMYKGFPLEAQRSNNFGFLSPHDYPVRPTPRREVIVGLFGGSVATSLALRETGAGVLARRLASVPAFAGRPILVVPFAQPGYKQPQQLLALSYFLALGQDFDLVINVDGLNEAVLPRVFNPPGPSGEGPMDVTMPAGTFYAPLLAVAARGVGEEADEVPYLRSRAARLGAEAVRARTGAVYFVKTLSASLAERRYQAALGEAKKSPGGGAVALFRENLSEEALDEKTVRVWADSSRAMQGLLEKRGVPYVHVLQPNVFFPVVRRHPTDRVPDDVRPLFVQSVGASYPRMQRAGKALTAEGVLFLDATGLFDAEPVERAYLDDCCHLTDGGADVFLARVGEFAAGRLQSGSRKR